MNLKLRRKRGTRFPEAVLAAVLLAVPLFLTGSLEAQAPRDRPPLAEAAREGSLRGEMDPIQRHLFSPEIVMRLRDEISLTNSQRETLIAEMQSAQSDLVPLRFEAQEAQQALARLIRESRPDEARVLDQARRVMDAETHVRTRHLALLVRIKNLLTPEQQAQLRELQRRHRARRSPRR